MKYIILLRPPTMTGTISGMRKNGLRRLRKPEFEKFAKTFFGTDGIIVPACSTLDGKPMGGWPQYSLSPTMTVWAAQSFDEYYLYTGDIEFLRTRAYPFFRGVGKAISGIMEEKDGRLFLPLRRRYLTTQGGHIFSRIQISTLRCYGICSELLPDMRKSSVKARSSMS